MSHADPNSQTVKAGNVLIQFNGPHIAFLSLVEKDFHTDMPFIDIMNHISMIERNPVGEEAFIFERYVRNEYGLGILDILKLEQNCTLYLLARWSE